jgi:serine/threonine-protein kinase
MGLTKRRAEDRIFKAGLRARIEMVASMEPKGEIIEQSPRGGARVSQGSVVSVRISSGEAPKLLDLRGLSVDRISAALSAFNDETGLDLSWVRIDEPTDDSSAVGTVVRTVPGPGKMVAYEQRIQVYIGVHAPAPDEGEGEP